MHQLIGDLPAAGWARVLRWTALITAASAAISAVVATLILDTFGQGMNAAGLAASILLPIAIGGPLCFVNLLGLARLKAANHKLQVLASTDGLTACLNRRAFTSSVSDNLKGRGALLVIDADKFKVINDLFGHDRGDEVLQMIATTIKQSVRDGDCVGRLGGEEFGVFLRDASLDLAHHIGERIRTAIQTVEFAPDGRPFRLSVSIGGACFDRDISFSELFRIADQRLYGVKQSGRNRTDVARAADAPPLALGLTALAG